MSRTLEQRYRWLLSWYPPEHREVYQEEMLGVLMEGAGPDRVRPTVAETTSLLGDAVRYRVRRAGRDFRNRSWRTAASVISVLAPALLLVLGVTNLLDVAVIGRYAYVDGAPPVGPSLWAPPVAWAVVILATLTRLRLVATVLGWVSLLVELGVQALRYHRFGSLANPSAAVVLLALTAAVTLTVGTGGSDGLRTLGRRRVVVLIIVGGFVAVGPWRDFAVNTAMPGWATAAEWFDWPQAVAVLVGLVTLLRVDGPLRRRILAVLIPLSVLAVLDAVFNNAFYVLPVRLMPNGPLPIQSAVLIVVAVVMFRLCVALVHRQERRSRQDTEPAR